MNLDDLHPTMRAACEALLAAYPMVQFTSGRRCLTAQAHAMACNCVTDRQWIAKTYTHAAALQTALDLHPEATTVQAIEDVLLKALLAMPDAERQKVSDHFGGLAVDLEPMEYLDQNADEWLPTQEGHAVEAWIRSYPKTKWFTRREAQLRRWHWAVHP